MSNSKQVKNIYVKIKDLSRPITKNLNLVLYLLDCTIYRNSFLTHFFLFTMPINVVLIRVKPPTPGIIFTCTNEVDSSD